jgi:hypothetical protein
MPWLYQKPLHSDASSCALSRHCRSLAVCPPPPARMRELPNHHTLRSIRLCLTRRDAVSPAGTPGRSARRVWDCLGRVQAEAYHIGNRGVREACKLLLGRTKRPGECVRQPLKLSGVWPPVPICRVVERVQAILGLETVDIHASEEKRVTDRFKCTHHDGQHLGWVQLPLPVHVRRALTQIGLRGTIEVVAHADKPHAC